MGKLFKAAFIVTFFSVLTRALGFVMRIILSRAVDPSTLGEYQIAMSIFAVMLTMISSGLPLIVSRKVAFLSASNKEDANKTTSSGLFLAIVVAVVFSVLIFVCKDLIFLITKNENIFAMVMLLVPALLSSSIYAILRGSLWGQKKFFMISFTEFFEQIVRIIFLLILLALPLKISGGEKATLSLTIACIFSSILVIVFYFKAGNKLIFKKGFTLPIIKESSTITATRTASSCVTMLISFIIPLRLMTFGFSETQAMAEFGIVTGMALPLITIPSTFISSIAVALVPEISAHTMNVDGNEPVKDKDGLCGKIATAISSTLLISFLFVGPFIALGKPIGKILFASDRAGTFISAGAVLMITMGFMQIMQAILNAIGLEVKALKNYAIGSVGLLLCIWFLPKYLGVMSLVVAMLVLDTTSGILAFNMLKKRGLIKSSPAKLLLKLTICTIFTTLITFFTYNLLIKLLPMLISCFFAGILSVCCYASMCYALGIFSFQAFLSKNVFSIFKKRQKANA